MAKRAASITISPKPTEADKPSTTLIVVLILYFFGGDVLQTFAFALIIGVLIGTYSSIFIASPIMLYLETKYPIPEITDDLEE